MAWSLPANEMDVFLMGGDAVPLNYNKHCNHGRHGFRRPSFQPRPNAHDLNSGAAFIFLLLIFFFPADRHVSLCHRQCFHGICR